MRTDARASERWDLKKLAPLLAIDPRIPAIVDAEVISWGDLLESIETILLTKLADSSYDQVASAAAESEFDKQINQFLEKQDITQEQRMSILGMVAQKRMHTRAIRQGTSRDTLITAFLESRKENVRSLSEAEVTYVLAAYKYDSLIRNSF